ncbi:MAG: hydroxymethylbilane synthase [Acidobacteriota bacterium]
MPRRCQPTEGVLRIGSRGSTLALAQTHWVRDQIQSRFPDLRIEVRVIKTFADRRLTLSVRSSSATGVWVKELEEALLAGEIDLAVHSMKDLPTRIPDALEVAAIPLREDARDALVASRGIRRLQDLPAGAVVGTGSIRRQAQLLARCPGVVVREIRGNVDTRLKKLSAGGLDAVILACAGLNRLGLGSRITSPIALRDMLPAPGQGALALETRRDEDKTSRYLSEVHHAPTAIAVTAERAFLRNMAGGCNSPIGSHARLEAQNLTIVGLIAAPEGKPVIRRTVTAASSAAEEAGAALAEEVLSRGGAAILRALGRRT